MPSRGSARRPCPTSQAPPGDHARGCQRAPPTAPPPQAAGRSRRSAPGRRACPSSVAPSWPAARSSEPTWPSQALLAELAANPIPYRNPEPQQAVGHHDLLLRNAACVAERLFSGGAELPVSRERRAFEATRTRHPPRLRAGWMPVTRISSPAAIRMGPNSSSIQTSPPITWIDSVSSRPGSDCGLGFLLGQCGR